MRNRTWVAPYAGAWIEILNSIISRISPTSLPTRERGLKFCHYRHHTVSDPSLPTRERGLKCFVHNDSVWVMVVAPYAGAWIEITARAFYEDGTMSLPTRERGLKSDNGFGYTAPTGSLPTRERGLKSLPPLYIYCGMRSLPTRERGLKYLMHFQVFHIRCRSLRGSVD